MESDDIVKVRGIPLATVLEGLGARRDPKDAARNWRLRAPTPAPDRMARVPRYLTEVRDHSVHREKSLFIAKSDAKPTAAQSYQTVRGPGLIISTTGSAVEFPARMASALKIRGY
jgi:hypothetical protein